MPNGLIPIGVLSWDKNLTIENLTMLGRDARDSEAGSRASEAGIAGTKKPPEGGSV